jgi:hypothetical protein
MSSVGKAFVAAFGRPDPEAPSGLHFKLSALDERWKGLRREIKSGWYAQRFLYLFGEGLDHLEPCLDAWAFLVPPNRDRMILGRNAHGTLLVLHDANTAEPSVHVLDPYRVAYWSNPDLAFINLLGYWLPEDQIPHFRERTVYDAWVKANGRPPADGMILAPKRPEGLGAPFDLTNFQEEEIVSFYQTTGPVYAKAFSTMGRPKPGVRAKKPAPPKGRR